MKSEERKFVRAVVRRVHPDLFAAHPQERLHNSESLKARLPHLKPRHYSPPPHAEAEPAGWQQRGRAPTHSSHRQLCWQPVAVMWACPGRTRLHIKLPNTSILYIGSTRCKGSHTPRPPVRQAAFGLSTARQWSVQPVMR